MGLGSNVGDRLHNLRRAVELLVEQTGRLVTVSSIYETEPIGPSQPDFLNAVCVIDTKLDAESLHSRLKGIEAELGRVPGERWGPRLIDLDLLLFGDQTVDSEDLKIPHPAMTERAFVLVPLLEADPVIQLPNGRRISDFPIPNDRVQLFAPPSVLQGRC